ncbi:hypothetical protein BDV93DRAFT_516112 [Ceratobasidium sp. AG-I]|nr:hypothetical protein BDV93DRAFT_516112 [Ceratobasidium sp. AG-I]
MNRKESREMVALGADSFSNCDSLSRTYPDWEFLRCCVTATWKDIEVNVIEDDRRAELHSPVVVHVLICKRRLTPGEQAHPAPVPSALSPVGPLAEALAPVPDSYGCQRALRRAREDGLAPGECGSCNRAYNYIKGKETLEGVGIRQGEILSRQERGEEAKTGNEVGGSLRRLEWGGKTGNLGIEIGQGGKLEDGVWGQGCLDWGCALNRQAETATALVLQDAEGEDASPGSTAVRASSRHWLASVLTRGCMPNSSNTARPSRPGVQIAKVVGRSWSTKIECCRSVVLSQGAGRDRPVDVCESVSLALVRSASHLAGGSRDRSFDLGINPVEPIGAEARAFREAVVEVSQIQKGTQKECSRPPNSPVPPAVRPPAIANTASSVAAASQPPRPRGSIGNTGEIVRARAIMMRLCLVIGLCNMAASKSGRAWVGKVSWRREWDWTGRQSR